MSASISTSASAPLSAPVSASVSASASAAFAEPAPHPWDDAAQGWDHHATSIRTWLHGATAAMLDAAQLTRGARVLDIAAGAGDQTLDIAQRIGPGGAVLATDISPRILALAQDRKSVV